MRDQMDVKWLTSAEQVFLQKAREWGFAMKPCKSVDTGVHVRGQYDGRPDFEIWGIGPKNNAKIRAEIAKYPYIIKDGRVWVISIREQGYYERKKIEAKPGQVLPEKRPVMIFTLQLVAAVGCENCGRKKTWKYRTQGQSSLNETVRCKHCGAEEKIEVP
jgi:hypothetical protein